MSTQVALARKGIVTKEMRHVAASEGIPVEQVVEGLAAGTIVIPANPAHKNLEPVGIGAGLKVKVNVNLGRSQTASCLTEEMGKVDLAVRLGADAVMDLSTGPEIEAVRAAVLARSTKPVGTVPVYEVAEGAADIADVPADAFVDVVRRQAEQGVDFMTIHAGVLMRHMSLVKRRTTGIVSRGGALIARWMEKNGRENPYYDRFDEILEIAARHDVTLSLGDGLRPGCLHDASDDAQFAELETLGALAERCRKANVQVMIEGPGHIPVNQIEMNMRREKEVCKGAPFYVLGPIVTDIAPGYDHITGAIGATIAAVAGADFLCYVTPKEHLGLPDLEDVRTGLIAFKIAAHAADLARGVKGARDADDAMAVARFNFEWERQFSLALDPERAREYHEASNPSYRASRFCSMCGPKFCPMRLSAELQAEPSGMVR